MDASQRRSAAMEGSDAQKQQPPDSAPTRKPYISRPMTGIMLAQASRNGVTGMTKPELESRPRLVNEGVMSSKSDSVMAATVAVVMIRLID